MSYNCDICHQTFPTQRGKGIHRAACVKKHPPNPGVQPPNPPPLAPPLPQQLAASPVVTSLTTLQSRLLPMQSSRRWPSQDPSVPRPVRTTLLQGTPARSRSRERSNTTVTPTEPMPAMPQRTVRTHRVTTSLSLMPPGVTLQVANSKAKSEGIQIYCYK